MVHAVLPAHDRDEDACCNGAHGIEYSYDVRVGSELEIGCRTWKSAVTLLIATESQRAPICSPLVLVLVICMQGSGY